MASVITEMLQKARGLLSAEQSMNDAAQATVATNPEQPQPSNSTDLANSEVGTPFKNIEIQMLTENVPLLQQQVGFSIIQPPIISNVGPMFQQSIEAHNLRSQQEVSANGAGGVFSFMQRVGDMLQAARQSVSMDGLFWIPQRDKGNRFALDDSTGTVQSSQTGESE